MINNIIRAVYDDCADHDKMILRATLPTPQFRNFLQRCIAKTNEDLQELDYRDPTKLQHNFITLTERKAAAREFLTLLTLFESELKAQENSNEIS